MFAKKLVDLILPPRCGACQKIVMENTSLCGECFPKARFITPPFCKICGLPFEHENTGSSICLSCAAQKPAFDEARFAMLYDDFSKELILSFKHGDRCDLAPLFAKWMYANSTDMFEGCDILIPVPIHWKRLVKRKYNQAGLLSSALSNISAVPTDHHLIKRIKNTKPQGHLSPSMRKKNQQGAFVCEEDLSGKTIMLIDDVYTTGTTLENCTKVLKKKGARVVKAITLARVLKE